MPYNLKSRNSLLEPIDLSNLTEWYIRETTQVVSKSIRSVLVHVGEHLSDFVHFPQRAILLWSSCDRTAPSGKKQRYHRYPLAVQEIAKAQGIKLDTRPNGPAIASFQLAGGIRPERYGSTNNWTVHHLYSGKFPYLGHKETKHAVKFGSHFTQSAGIITAHPIADAMCDEFPFFAWLLRAQAFSRFSYDPDAVFTESPNEFGFAKGSGCEIIWRCDDVINADLT